jgi:hypothetical protein
MPRRRIKAIDTTTNAEYVTGWTDSYEHAINAKEDAQEVGGDKFRYVVEEDINFDGVPDTDITIEATEH